MRVDVGYIEDETGTQVAQILVARRANLKNIDWTYPMIAPAAVVPMPSRQQPAAQQADDTRIVARESEPSTKEVSNE
jgi:hypothetical protein